MTLQNKADSGFQPKLRRQILVRKRRPPWGVHPSPAARDPEGLIGQDRLRQPGQHRQHPALRLHLAHRDVQPAEILPWLGHSGSGPEQVERKFGRRIRIRRRRLGLCVRQHLEDHRPHRTHDRSRKEVFR